MATIKKIQGKIISVKDLTPTAREITIRLEKPLEFIAGAFVNVFLPHEGEKIRRAFSISSSDTEQNQISLSIRLKPDGKVTPLFWQNDYTNTELEIMGPLGFNTADKMTSENIYLFGFGIGAGVVKSLAENLITRPNLKNLTIITGNRSEDEIIYKDFFDNFSIKHPNVNIQYVLTKPTTNKYPTGYIQNHISDLNFNDSDVYICGQKTACDALQETIKTTTPINCKFFIEDFH